jgi:hypothetical protein
VDPPISVPCGTNSGSGIDILQWWRWLNRHSFLSGVTSIKCRFSSSRRRIRSASLPASSRRCSSVIIAIRCSTVTSRRSTNMPSDLPNSSAARTAARGSPFRPLVHTSAAEGPWKGRLESALGGACAVAPGGGDAAQPPESKPRCSRPRIAFATFLGSWSRQSSSRLQGGSRHRQR